MSKIKFTRSDYMNNKCSHREYYGQFVTPYVLQLVANSIGLDKIKASKDPHFNDIPLQEWDRIWMRRTPQGGYYIVPPMSISEMLREAKEGNSAATGTCILKEAARQLAGRNA